MEKRIERHPNRKSHKVTFSLPKEIVIKMDADRGDISRSRYVLRLIEKAYANTEVGDNDN
ncbi:MAG: hypothetical protein ACRD97_06695 [Nitrososphaeraceae archaeon]